MKQASLSVNSPDSSCSSKDSKISLYFEITLERLRRVVSDQFKKAFWELSITLLKSSPEDKTTSPIFSPLEGSSISKKIFEIR